MTDPTPQPDENVSPRTEARRLMEEWIGLVALDARDPKEERRIATELLDRIEREASSPALDVERLAEAIPTIFVDLAGKDARLALAARILAHLAHPDSDGDAR